MWSEDWEARKGARELDNHNRLEMHICIQEVYDCLLRGKGITFNIGYEREPESHFDAQSWFPNLFHILIS